MSSATSIEGRVRAQRESGRGWGPASAEKVNGFRPWHFFVLLSLVAATAAVAMAQEPSPEHLVLLSLAIGAAGLCGAGLYATLAPLVRKEDDVKPVLSTRSRVSLEREKALVLRSIKELEFDRAMGKMSAADFDEMANRLRARAISLIKALDAPTPDYRARVEEDLASRVSLASSNAGSGLCACGTQNDADARFCKACGERLRPERGAASPSERERGWGPASTEK